MRTILFYCRTLAIMMVFGTTLMNTDARGQCNDCNTGSTGCGGTGADASGDCSYAQGFNAEASGLYSVAIGPLSVASGNRGIAIGGDESTASGYYSLALGIATSSGSYSVSLGNEVRMQGSDTYGFGKQIRSGIDSENNITIGFGSSSALQNDIDNCIMFGMNSTVPTMFLEDAGGYSGGIGRVGIGTTVPEGILHLRDESGDDTELVIDRNGTAEANLRFNVGSTTEVARIGISANGGVSNNNLFYENFVDGLHHIFKVTVNNTLTEAMRISGINAHVGIGAFTPDAKLQVVHEATTAREEVARFAVSDAVNDWLQIRNGSTTDDEFVPEIFGETVNHSSQALRLTASIDSTTDTGTDPVMMFVSRIKNNPPDPVATRPLFAWQNAGGSSMLMDANGNLGIGTTSPQGRLDVNGTVFINASSLGTPTLTTNDHYVGIDIGTNQLIDLGTSTIEFKDDVENLEFDKEAFLNLRPVDFRWKPFHGGQLDVGLIAQEVAQTFPALATSSYKRTYLPNGDMERDSIGVPVVDSTQTEIRGVRYHKLPVYLLALAQDQQNELDELRTQVEELTDRLNGCCSDVEPMYRLSETENQAMGDSDKVDEFILLRNDPNPFSDYTDIRYDHEGCLSCEIIVSDVSGRIVKRMKTSGSRGVVRVYSSELGTGMFVYSLVKDGSIVRSETMVSSKH